MNTPVQAIDSGLEISPYSIGVVTYHARFDAYFVPLIERLASVFPDRQILCIINGHPDRTLQIKYLKKVTAFLSRFPNIRYLTYDLNQSLSKCWNQLVILSETDKVLIMNDDTQVTDLFRQEFESKAIGLPFSTLNVSWSHFLISKDIIRKVGWFDERLLGVGHEDADYGLRMTMAGLPVTDTTCLGLNNYVVDQENPGWKSISGKVSDNKYSQVNFEYFNEKWNAMDMNPGSQASDFRYTMRWNGGEFHFSPRMDDVTPPMFYEYDCLDNASAEQGQEYYVHRKKSLTVLAEKAFYFCRQVLKKLYRSVVK